MTTMKHTNVTVKDIMPAEQPEKMMNGVGYLAKFNYANIQTPKMVIPFDCRPTSPMSGTGRPTCKLAMQFNAQSAEIQGEHKEFYDMLQAVDNAARKYVEDNASFYFPKKGNKKLKHTFEFTPSIKDKNEKYNPFFSVKVDFTGDENEYDIKPSCYTMDGDLLTGSYALQKGNEIISVVRPEYIWCISGRFGITWKLVRSVVTQEGRREDAFDFDLSDELALGVQQLVEPVGSV